jgi:UDP-glucose 4-epimerase
MTKILVTGGAGFIGSHMVDALIQFGHKVTVFDNFSSGRMENIERHFDHPNFKLIEGDLCVGFEVQKACEGQDIIIHMAANPDVRLGSADPAVHFDNNVVATYNLLECMRYAGVKKILFTSSSTVYGETCDIPTPETCGSLEPISVYGASKLASEALITAYCHSYGMQSWIFRFANVIGDRGTHGIIWDFIRKLLQDHDNLEILGDGKQEKSYISVIECIQMMVFVTDNATDKVNIFNIGSDDTIIVNNIARIVVREMGLNKKHVEFTYTGGARGWVGDVPNMWLSIEKLKQLGYTSHNLDNGLNNSSNYVSEAVNALIKE